MPARPSLAPSLCRLFDLAPRDRRRRRPVAPIEVVRAAVPAPGQVTLLTGPSGAGKTCLLGQARDLIDGDHADHADLASVALPNRPTIDCVAARLGDRVEGEDEPAAEARVVEALRLLSAVGLAEARDYLRPPRNLSEGQRFRLKLAMALARPAAAAPAPLTLVCDEFAASLDDLTAAVVARCLRRVVDARGETLSAVVVTGRAALRRPLAPDVIVHCDFDDWRVERRAAGNGTGKA